jgi:hypothetical protein
MAAGDVTVRHRNDLEILTHAADQLAGVIGQVEEFLQEAKTTVGAGRVVETAGLIHSDLLRTKDAVEDELVAWVLDCERCGRPMHWVPGDGCDLGRWAHSEPALSDHRPGLGPVLASGLPPPAGVGVGEGVAEVR